MRLCAALDGQVSRQPPKKLLFFGTVETGIPWEFTAGEETQGQVLVYGGPPYAGRHCGGGLLS